MSEPYALVARITITPENLERWLDSTVPPAHTWADDWEAWWQFVGPVGGGSWGVWGDWSGTVRGVVLGLLDERKDLGGIFSQSWYDEKTNVWRLLALELTENCSQMIEYLTPFRAAAEFSECSDDDYVAFTGCFYDGDAQYSLALAQFSEGGTAMLLDHATPARVRIDIESQFAQVEKDNIILPYRFEQTPPDGVPIIPEDYIFPRIAGSSA